MIIAEHHKADGYVPSCAWPDDCYVQWGGRGIVFKKVGIESGIETLTGALTGDKDKIEQLPALFVNSYTTAFFEAFPKKPDTFIRGEGKTIAEAEAGAFEKFTKIAACPGHEFERRGYTNGGGFCIHCGMFKGKAFEPSEKCCQCGAFTYHSQDKDGRFWCEACYPNMPREIWPAWRYKYELEGINGDQERDIIN